MYFSLNHRMDVTVFSCCVSLLHTNTMDGPVSTMNTETSTDSEVSSKPVKFSILNSDNPSKRDSSSLITGRVSETHLGICRMFVGPLRAN